MSPNGRTLSGQDGSWIASAKTGMTTCWRFAPATEAHFEPLLAIRMEVMREHLERVFRYKPSRARRVFREHFAEPGLRSGL